MNEFLTYENLCRKVNLLKDSYWKDTMEMRWEYMKNVIDELTRIAPKTALELGTNRISLMNFSDCMDMDESYIDPENSSNKVFIMDATKTPWPIADKQYDIFVALQVMEHLSPAQSHVFSEIQRIARYAVISVPYKWDSPNFPSHHNIGEELIRKWTNHYPPYKIMFTGKENKCRVAWFFKFETDVITHTICFPLRINYPQAMITRRFVPSDKRELINTYFDNIYLITSKSRKDRLNRMQQMLSDLNISVEVCEAPDGLEEPHYAEFQEYRRLPPGAVRDTDRELQSESRDIASPEAWIQLKTFRTLLRDMISKGYKRVLILEDDIIFVPQFHQKFKELTESLAGFQWKILMIGADQQQWKMPADLRYEDPGITDFDPSRPFYYPVNTLGTFALGLDISVVNDYLPLIERMQYSCEQAMLPLFRRWFLHCFVAVPNLIIKVQADKDSSNASHSLC